MLTTKPGNLADAFFSAQRHCTKSDLEGERTGQLVPTGVIGNMRKEETKPNTKAMTIQTLAVPKYILRKRAYRVMSLGGRHRTRSIEPFAAPRRHNVL